MSVARRVMMSVGYRRTAVLLPTERHTNFNMTTHLDRLLFSQGGECFFCRKPLPKADASVEHLVASANGGTSEDGNCVACCKALNHLLGSKSIKEKLQIVLNQKGKFQCPGSDSAPTALVPKSSAQAIAAKSAQVIVGAATVNMELVLSDLKKRGASRPRKVSTLTSTIKALLKQHQKTATDTEVAGLIAELQKRGKVTIDETKVTYKLG